MNILVGDVGATNCRLALISHGKMSRPVVYKSKDWSGLESVVRDFLKNVEGRIESACFGVPGPVMGGSARLTNLGWRVSEASLRRVLRTRRVRVVNDFVAVGHAVGVLRKKDFTVLQKGIRVKDAPVAVLGAGTDLGQCLVVPCRGRDLVLPGEGAHIDLPMRSVEERAFHDYVSRLRGFARVGSVLSGEGIVLVYDFLREHHSLPESVSVREDLKSAGLPAVIVEHAVKGKDELCVRAVDLFLSFYGRVAANLALVSLPYGGVFIAGGIAPKMKVLMGNGVFTASFRDNPVMGDVLKKIPVFLVTNEFAGLVGAGVIAKSL